jgi:uncharacterized protein YjbJ (UPF0337 family)
MAEGLWDRIKGNWNQMKGRAKQEWGDLTDDDLTYVEGSMDRLVGKLQDRYGWAKMEAEEHVNRWANDMDSGGYTHSHTHSHDEM